jgi:two-component system NarL family response regulator
LIADDHAVVRDGLAAMLARRREFDVVGEAADGEQAVGQALALRPDVCLLDLQMPRLGGVDAIARIRAAWPGARILVLTTFDGDEDIYRALQAGAAGYLLKDTPRDEILASIEAVHAGSRVIPPLIAAKLAER